MRKQKHSINLLIISICICIIHKMVEGFQYDYCSIRHSVQVLQELRGEIIPIINKYSIQINSDKCPMFNQEILQTHFQLHYNISLDEHRLSSMTECSKCGKKFTSRDYLEFHWKHRHVDTNSHQIYPISQAFESQYPSVSKEFAGKADGICLADYCDIFECKEYPDMGIKHTTFSQKNYERKQFSKSEVNDDDLAILRRSNKQMTKYIDRFDVDDVLEEGDKENAILFNVKWYTDKQKSMLLEKCVTLFSNCLINTDSQIVNDYVQKYKIMSAFDILYSNYCKKFEVKERVSGVEIEPSFENKFYMIEESARQIQIIDGRSIWFSLKVIAIVLSCVGTILYYLGVYLVKYETDEV